MMLIFCPIFLVLAVVILLALLSLFDNDVLGWRTGTAGGVRFVGDNGTTSAVLFACLTRLRGGENKPTLLLGIGGEVD